MFYKKIVTLLFLFPFLIVFPACLFSLDDINGVENYCRAAVMEFFNGNYEKSMDMLQKDSVIPDSEFNDLKISTVRQMSLIKERFGKAKNFIQASSSNVKDRFYKTVYVIFYQNHIIRLEFIFFKPEQSWKLNNFIWDDNISALF